MTKFGLRSTVYHETIPGHHFQIALETEDKTRPRFRQIRAFGNISAFGEGWGLYAERLTAESGWYGEDVEGFSANSIPSYSVPAVSLSIPASMRNAGLASRGSLTA